MPCESRVRVWFDEKGKEFKLKLFCDGKCNKGDAKDCAETQQAEGSVNVIYHFCGCDGGKSEPETCHIVLKEIKDGATSAFNYECRKQGCKDNEECTPMSGKSDLVAILEKGKYRGKLG